MGNCWGRKENRKEAIPDVRRIHLCKQTQFRELTINCLVFLSKKVSPSHRHFPSVSLFYLTKASTFIPYFLVLHHSPKTKDDVAKVYVSSFFWVPKTAFPANFRHFRSLFLYVRNPFRCSAFPPFSLSHYFRLRSGLTQMAQRKGI